MTLPEPTRCRFTGAARAAAAEARRRRREEAPPSGTPETHGVRPPDARRQFGRDIRRFGGAVLDGAKAGHATPDAARSAMAAILNVVDPRPMSFETHSLAGDGRAGRWQWTVRSSPDLAILRDGQVDGDRDKAERAARAAIANMGGVVRRPDHD